MTLISLILVLMIERFTVKTQYWQAEYYLGKYQDWIDKHDWLKGEKASWLWIVFIAVPSIVASIFLFNSPFSLFEFVLQTSLLMLCVGCPALRAAYKCYLKAASDGDIETCDIYAQNLASEQQDDFTYGQNLVWMNYQHYTAVIVWFVIFGVPGAILYVVLRSFRHRYAEHDFANWLNQVMFVADWLPVRITALGFLLVGHFSRALPIWLEYLFHPKIEAKAFLINVSVAAEEVDCDTDDCTTEPCMLVKLAKRNVLFMLVAVSILTLTGFIS